MARTRKKTITRSISIYAQRIRDLREDHDMTQAQVASVLHVSQRTYADYELGNIRIPVDSITMLAKLYDTDMNYICGISKFRHPYPNF